MKYYQHMAGLLGAMVLGLGLAGCGSGASTGKSDVGPIVTPTPIAAQLEVASSATQLDSSGLNTATILVTAKNANNTALAGVVIDFTASSGNLVVNNATTDNNGVAKATIAVGANKSNRTITIKAVSGTINNSVDLDVRGTMLTASGPTAVGLGSTIQILTSLKDSHGTAIANTQIGLQSVLGNGANKQCLPANCMTDSSGTLTFTYAPSSGGVDTITLSALNSSATLKVSAATSQITITVPSDGAAYIDNEYAINQGVGAIPAKTIGIKLVGAAAYPATVALSSTAGTLQPSTLSIPDANTVVNASFKTNASVGQGLIYVQDTATGGVSNSFPFEIVSRTPASITLQASPAVIPANLTGTTNKSTVTATVRDGVGNPVKNALVTFSKPQDSSGGSLQTATALTNASGLAVTSFIAGPNSASGTGVTVVGVVQGVVNSAYTNVVVAQQALYVNLGFSNKLAVENTSRYAQEFSISITNAAGQAVSGANISVDLKADQFYKGTMIKIKNPEGVDIWRIEPTAICPNENTNHNATIEAGEDSNGNGRLDPGIRPSVSFVSGGTLPNTTDVNGLANYKMSYFKQDSQWSSYIITVSSGTAQGGAQGNASQIYTLPILIDDLKDVSVSAPNMNSPFGKLAGCNNTN